MLPAPQSYFEQQASMAESRVYQKNFNLVTENLRSRVYIKIKDRNILKSNVCNPHYKSIVISDVPRLSFAALFGRKFKGPETRERKIMMNSPRSFSI